jgi:hypothetical protein
MPDQNNPHQTDPHKDDPKNVQPADELSDDELDSVAGGRDTSAPSVSEIVVTKSNDSSSTKLLN